MEWIKVTPDTMPREEENVIVAFTVTHKTRGHYKMIETNAFLRDCEWYYVYDKLVPASRPIKDSYKGKIEVTHWMPWPKLPEQ